MKKEMSFDHQAVERFNQELDRLLCTGELRAEARQDALHNEMLSIANALATAKLETLSKGCISLRNRLLSNEASPAHRPKSRAMKVAAVLALGLVLLTTIFAASPPLRSWAQEVLARVGALIITDAPTYAEQELPRRQTATPQRTPWPTLEPLSQEEASQRAGFTVLIPRNLPEWRQDFIHGETDRGFVVGVYDGDGCGSVFISQMNLTDKQEKEFPIGDADVLEVTVRGQTGYWIEEAATSLIKGGSIFYRMEDLDWHLGYENILTWEEGGIVYVIHGDDEHSLDDLLTIAESLAP